MKFYKFQVGDRVCRTTPYLELLQGVVVGYYQKEEIDCNIVNVRWDKFKPIFQYREKFLTLIEVAIDKLDEIL